MRNRAYMLAFILVLLLACVGGFFGGRYLLGLVQRDLAPRSEWTPAPPPASGGQASPTVPVTSRPPASTDAARPVTPTTEVLPSPDTPPARPVSTSTLVPASETPDVEVATAEPTPAETATETPPPVGAFPFTLARAVRHSTGDCPGVYILGVVTDRAGIPLPDVRLKLVDEFGNAATAQSKSGQSDLGKYDFPLSGPPRRFYLTVVDAADQAQSAVVEIGHGLPPNADATCHWIDWRRR